MHRVSKGIEHFSKAEGQHWWWTLSGLGWASCWELCQVKKQELISLSHHLLQPASCLTSLASSSPGTWGCTDKYPSEKEREKAYGQFPVHYISQVPMFLLFREHTTAVPSRTHTPGFQKSSANTTRSAAESVRPMFAAVRDKTATTCFSETWNFWHRDCRSAEGVEPSMRMYSTRCEKGEEDTF